MTGPGPHRGDEMRALLRGGVVEEIEGGVRHRDPARPVRESPHGRAPSRSARAGRWATRGLGDAADARPAGRDPVELVGRGPPPSRGHAGRRGAAAGRAELVSSGRRMMCRPSRKTSMPPATAAGNGQRAPARRLKPSSPTKPRRPRHPPPELYVPPPAPTPKKRSTSARPGAGGAAAPPQPELAARVHVGGLCARRRRGVRAPRDEEAGDAAQAAARGA